MDLEQYFVKYLKSFGIQDAEIKVLMLKLKKQHVPKGQSWLVQGDKPSVVAFILKGHMKKVLVTEKGNELVKDFVWELQHVAPYSALLLGIPAQFSIVAIEDTELLELPFKELEKLYEEDMRFLRMGKKIAEEHFVESEARELALLGSEPEKIMREFIKEHPKVFNRISLKDMSSFLGIHPASLSRIRRRISSKR